MYDLDITTTATVRPDILGRTYDSFARNLKDFNFKTKRCVINVDPIPDFCDPMSCVDVAKRFFKEVVYNITVSPNYSQAYNWVWKNAKTKLILNIEDDWELVQKISMRHFVEAFENSSTLYQAVFRAYDYTYPACCTSPQVLHERFYKAVAGKLNPLLNPEHQIHHKGEELGGIKCDFKKNKIEPSDYVIAIPKHQNQIVVRDLGRQWSAERGFTIPKKKFFISWVKVGEPTEKICDVCEGSRRVRAWTFIAGQSRLMSLPCGACIDADRICHKCHGIGVADNMEDICEPCGGTGIKPRKKGEQKNEQN